MSNKLFLSVISISVVLTVVSCGRINTDNLSLYPFQNKSGKWGYIDDNGKTMIRPKFYQAGQFSEDLAAVWLGEKWGYINKKGEIVIEPRFWEAEAFKDGFAQVIEDDTRDWHYSFINKKGETVFSWESIDYNYWFLSEGLMPVRIYPDNGDGPLYGYTNEVGQWKIPPQYDNAFEFNEGFAVVLVDFQGWPGSGKYGFINPLGEMVIEAQFAEAEGFSEGLAAVKIGDYDTGKWGYINREGEVVIPPLYDGAEGFSHGLAAVKIGEFEDARWGFINKEGKMVIEPHFSLVSDFSEEGLAAAWIGESYSPNGQCEFIDTTGKCVIDLDIHKLSKVAGFELDYRSGKFMKEGKLILVEMAYTTYMPSENSGCEIVNTTRRWGYMNTKGEFVWLSEIEKSQEQVCMD